MNRMRFEAWLSEKDGKWYWTLYANNNEAIAQATQGYSSKEACLKGIRSVRFNAPIAKLSRESVRK